MLFLSCQSTPSNELANTTPSALKLRCGDELERFLQFPERESLPKRQRDEAQKQVEFLFFQASCDWNEVYNWQNAALRGESSSSAQAARETTGRPVVGLGEVDIVLSAYKPQDGEDPSIQLLVYDQPYRGQSKDYLERIRRKWQRSERIREIEAPILRSFGNRNNYGYLLHFMSPEYLYQEFILFVQNRAVHFIFQSPHRMLEISSALESFYCQVNRELEQGIYFRKLRV